MPKHKRSGSKFAATLICATIGLGLLPDYYSHFVSAQSNSSETDSNPGSKSTAIDSSSDAAQPDKSKITFTRVDRSANTQAYAQAAPIPKYYSPNLSRPVIPGYSSSPAIASYYAQGPAKQSQLRSYPMASLSPPKPMPAVGPMAAEPYGTYWNDGEAVQPDMQMWQSQGSYGSGQYGGMVQPQETMMTYPPNYGGLNGMGGMAPTSPYAGYLEKQIATYPVMIYTLNDCIPCQKAKHLLAVNYPDVRAHFLELSGNQPWQQQLQIDLQYLTGAMTFPYIFVCGQYIGGQSDLQELHETGQLRRMVSQCLKTAVPK
ncbi:glutaredoxin domain-containing protein [Ditylenchus destructor]|uniref:Glutaredoxin domain-containing protein n=1 Tax=Ditylenchus destructor TaxID=166010 RepID=A0AAD4R040_9BILA|nr:glutaredoxin domain-containing protein [Ditylenchus destructor]